MRYGLVCTAMAVAVLVCADAAQAQSALAYDFETIVLPNGPDGYFGLGATVSQEPTIGVTHGDNSLKYVVGVGGFVGARTEAVIPAALNDPPGVAYVLFDLTLTETYTDTFADLGITVFGHQLNATPQVFGHQVQFADQYPMAGLAPGTYLDQRIDLDFSVGPYRPGESFNDIFGPGENDLTVASAFQFFINKNVLTPITVYIDNVRLVVPEPATFGLLGMGAVVIGAIGRRRRAN